MMSPMWVGESQGLGLSSTGSNGAAQIPTSSYMRRQCHRRWWPNLPCHNASPALGFLISCPCTLVVRRGNPSYVVLFRRSLPRSLGKLHSRIIQNLCSPDL